MTSAPGHPLNPASRWRVTRRLAALCLVAPMAWAACAGAAGLYKWVDENGNVVYQDTPPPSGVEYEQPPIREPADPDELILERLEAATALYPVALYAVPQCAACDLVRAYLQQHAIPFAEKDLANDVAVQDELEALTGVLRAPTLAVGDTVIDGYSQSAMREVLLEKGYPLGEIPVQEAP